MLVEVMVDDSNSLTSFRPDEVDVMCWFTEIRQ